MEECSPRVNDKNTLATSPNKSSSKDLQKVKATPKPIISIKYAMFTQNNGGDQLKKRSMITETII